jgi:inorganic pyrophosphatase
MDIKKIPFGKNPPEEINVVIEIPSGSDPVKYEFDKKSGALFVDRFLNVSMTYPGNYGFIPNTLSGDGDPCDVIVVADMPLIPGCVVSVRPIGVLLMEDESGQDEKILAVPTSKISTQYNNVKSYFDLPENMLGKITHFFENYKTLEKNKWVKVEGWADADKAKEMILKAIARAKSKKSK